MEKYKLVYKIDRNENYIRLLGETFFKKNKIQSYLIYKNKKFKLIDIFKTNNIKEEELKIDFVLYKKIMIKAICL